MKSNREIYRATGLPLLQNRAFASADEARACATGDVVLVQDSKTGLIFNDAFDPSLVAYDSDYQNEQAFSDVFRRHLENVAKVVKRHFHEGPLIEIGCGKAYFLETLQRMEYAITGFDPAYEGNNPDVRREYFTSSVGLEASGIILRHVLEHVPGPVAFLETIRDANGGGGLLYIEVPCFDWICTHRAWFDIYYEHVNYFRLSDLQRMFGTVLEAGHTFGGQYLYIVADLATLTNPSQSGFNPVDMPSDFLDGVSRHARHVMQQREKNHSRSAVWGAASKGVIFSLFMERAGAPVDVAIDVNPAKQGRHLPVTGVCIDSPANAVAQLEPGSDVFVMNTNYLDEIRNLSGCRFTYLTV